MKPFNIGIAKDNKAFHLPANIVTKTISILGLRGSGKSNTATVLVEEMLKQNLPPVIIDPTDAWWGLRSQYPVFIFGGSHGDLPLNETDGKAIAQFVVSEKVPVVLSLRHLRKSAQRRFVREFCEEIYHLKGKDENRTSLTIVIDEAPLFVPQKVFGEVAFVVGAVEDLIARGRNTGFGVVLISQRSATINKDVFTQSDVIITHRLTSPQDKKALAEWFEDNASTDKQNEIFSSLAELPDGRAWVWAPTLKIMEQVQVRRRETFDSSATPELGKAISAPKKLTEVNLELLKEKLTATVEKAKADDPNLLRAEIRRLNAELAVKPTVPVEKLIKEITRVPIITKDEMFYLQKVEMAARELAANTENLWQGLMEIKRDIERRKIEVVNEMPKALPPMSPPFKALITKRDEAGFATSQEAKVELSTARIDSSVGSGGAKRMMIAMAMKPGLNRQQLGIRAVLSSSSGSFGTYLSKLRTNEWIDDSNGQFRLTDKGMNALGSSYENLPTGEMLLAAWYKEIGDGGARRILEAVVGFHPNYVPREQIGRVANVSHTSGSFGTFLSKLRTLGLIEGKGELRATDEFFS